MHKQANHYFVPFPVYPCMKWLRKGRRQEVECTTKQDETIFRATVWWRRDANQIRRCESWRSWLLKNIVDTYYYNGIVSLANLKEIKKRNAKNLQKTTHIKKVTLQILQKYAHTKKNGKRNLSPKKIFIFP